MVPKIIMCFLINAVKETLSDRLVAALYREESFDELLQEDSKVVQDRLQCRHVLEVLQKADDIVNEVRDSTLIK
jgi:dynamin 1-like protein